MEPNEMWEELGENLKPANAIANIRNANASAKAAEETRRLQNEQRETNKLLAKQNQLLEEAADPELRKKRIKQEKKEAAKEHKRYMNDLKEYEARLRKHNEKNKRWMQQVQEFKQQCQDIDDRNKLLREEILGHDSITKERKLYLTGLPGVIVGAFLWLLFALALEGPFRADRSGETGSWESCFAVCVVAGVYAYRRKSWAAFVSAWYIVPCKVVLGVTDRLFGIAGDRPVNWKVTNIWRYEKQKEQYPERPEKPKKPKDIVKPVEPSAL